MKIRKILFVTKFEELNFDDLRTLLNLRRADLTNVVFMNVIERDKVAMRRGKGYEKEEEIRLRETANIRFIDWAESLFEEGMEVGVYIVVGQLVGEVIKAAEKENADIIVIGRSHKGFLERFYSGSDVTELIRRASIPILIYKDRADSPSGKWIPFQRPLLATDWSPASEKAVKYLESLGTVLEKVDVIHVASEKDLKGTSAMTVQKTRKEVRQKLETICERLEAAGIKARPHVYIGEAVEEIEKAAEECESTMIVMGSSAKPSWIERWLGSVPLAIAEKSIYPTLIIPPDK